MKRFILSASVGLFAIMAVSPSSAADLPPSPPAYKAPVYPSAPPTPIFSWTGFYIGANAGYVWAPEFADDANGFVGGGQYGYNYQIGSFIFGVEADFQATTIDSSETVGGVTATGKVKYFGTARGRIGYAWNRFLAYGTGGLAYTQTDLSATNGVTTLSDNGWSAGYALGAGLEWAVWDRWSVRGEYLFVNSGDTNLTLGGVSVGGDYNMNIARAAVNYRF